MRVSRNFNRRQRRGKTGHIIAPYATKKSQVSKSEQRHRCPDTDARCLSRATSRRRESNPPDAQPGLTELCQSRRELDGPPIARTVRRTRRDRRQGRGTTRHVDIPRTRLVRIRCRQRCLQSTVTTAVGGAIICHRRPLNVAADRRTTAATCGRPRPTTRRRPGCDASRHLVAASASRCHFLVLAPACIGQ